MTKLKKKTFDIYISDKKGFSFAGSDGSKVWNINL